MDLAQRIPETELMDDPEQAEAYAATDFEEPHQAFVTHFLRRFPDFDGKEVVDLGCGAADITVRFARAFPHVRVTGIDGAGAMLELGRRLIAQQGLTQRISLAQACLPDQQVSQRSFDAAISNSLLHHLPDPAVLWQTALACAKPTGTIFVMDLYRPQRTEDAEELVRLHAQGAPELLRRDFYCSLLAAYRPQEIEQQLDRAGLAHLTVEVITDRHMIVWGTLRP